MSVKPTPYRTFLLAPTTTTNYVITSFTDTVLDDASEYRVECEGAGATLSNKTSLGFTITVAYNSPASPNNVWLHFLRSGI